jgi:NitT/TauT family transport system substrate-binding protein
LSAVWLKNNTDAYAVDLVNGADALVAAFGAESHDVIFAPTNLGAKLIASGIDYVFAATVVWGNYYFVSTEKTDFSLASLVGKTITVFGQNQTSDIIVRYLLEANNIEATIEYVDAVATAAALFENDPTKIVLVAEPTLSVLVSRISGLQIIDLQTEYEIATGTDSFPQAGVFVKAELTHETVDAFLEDLANSVALVNADPVNAGLTAEVLGYGFEAEILALAVPTSHLAFITALASKEALEAYFNLILAMNPALIGGALPSDAFYYQP